MISESFMYSHTVAVNELHFGVLSAFFRILLKSLTIETSIEFSIGLLFDLMIGFEVR